MKIATTIGEMYPFTNSYEEAISAYEGTGFRYLDFSFYNMVLKENDPLMAEGWQDIILSCKETAKKLDFQFVQAHAPAFYFHEDYENGLKGTIRSIEACGMLGIKNMVIHSALFPEIKYPDDAHAYFKANEPFFRALIPAMEKHNVRILFENTTIKHCGDNCYFPILGKDLNAFIDYMDHPLFGAAWDVGHAHMDAIDHYTEIMDMKDNLMALHIHDNDGLTDQHTAPFIGSLDYDSLMRGLIESGYDGYFTLESDGFFRYGRSNNLSGPLAHPPLEVKKAALYLLYTICKSILSTYNVFEA